MSKTIQISKQTDVKEREPEILDLDAKVYPAYILVDEAGRPVETLRGAYETGDNDGEGGGFGISSIDYEGYRNFKVKRVMQSWNEITNFDEDGVFTPGYKKKQNPSSIVPISKIPRSHEKGGHTTIYGHEWVSHGKVNHLLTQNPVCKSKVDGGCGEDKIKYDSRGYHPISFKDSYVYWDEKQYLKIFENGEKSPDTYNLMNPLYFTCSTTKRRASSHIIYINPHNNQVYAWCPICKHRTNKKYEHWHQITNHETLEELSDELGIELIKYKKIDTEASILALVVECPGINHYQIAQDLEMTKGMVSRGVDRLKEKQLVRTRRVKKAICIYPILDTNGNGSTKTINENKKIETSDSLDDPSKNIALSPEPDSQKEITESDIFKLLEDYFYDKAPKCGKCGARLTDTNRVIPQLGGCESCVPW